MSELSIYIDMFYVYILYSEALDRYYIGQTNDLGGRLRRHSQSNIGYTSKGKPWKLVYKEQLLSRNDACDRELQIKNWKNRSRIEELIKTGSAIINQTV